MNFLTIGRNFVTEKITFSAIERIKRKNVDNSSQSSKKIKADQTQQSLSDSLSNTLNLNKPMGTAEGMSPEEALETVLDSDISRDAYQNWRNRLVAGGEKSILPSYKKVSLHQCYCTCFTSKWA